MGARKSMGAKSQRCSKREHIPKNPVLSNFSMLVDQLCYIQSLKKGSVWSPDDSKRLSRSNMSIQKFKDCWVNLHCNSVRKLWSLDWGGQTYPGPDFFGGQTYVLAPFTNNRPDFFFFFFFLGGGGTAPSGPPITTSLTFKDK